MGKIKNKRAFLLIPLFVGVLTFFYRWMPVGDDTAFHIGRIMNEVYMMREYGISKIPYYIFETSHEGFGYGAPLFYCDLLIYPFAVLVLWGVSKVAAYKMMMVCIIVLAFVSTYISVLWWKRNNGLALAGAIIYCVHPYFVSDIVERAAVGEAFALAFMPLAFCGLYLIIADELKKGTLLLGLGMCGVVCSHVISTLLISIYFVIIVVLFIKKIDRRKIHHLVIAFVLCCCLTMWYWLPMIEQLLEIDFATPSGGTEYVGNRVSIFSLFAPYGVYELVINRLKLLPEQGPYAPGGMIWFPIVIMIYVIARKECRKSKLLKLCLGSCIAFVILSSSEIFCEVLQNVIGMIQFPWRWYIILVPVSVIAFVDLMEKGNRKTKYFLILGTLALSILSVMMIMTRTVLQQYLPNQEARESLSDYETEREGFLDSLYIPESYSTDYYFKNGDKIGCNKDIKFAANRNRNSFAIRLDVEKCEDVSFELPLFMYKGYFADNIDTGEVYEVRESSNGLVEVCIQNYHGGDIRVYYRGTWGQKMSKIISIVSCCLFFLRIVVKRKQGDEVCYLIP